MNYYKRLLSALICIFMLFALTACETDKNSDSTNSISESQTESTEEIKDPVYLRKQLVGQWGRLEEVMHYFTEDNRCIVGGMQGTYEIDDDCTLVMTTMSGSVTKYVWAKSYDKAESNNYWYLQDDNLTVNGNSFTKIYGQETPDYVQ